MKSNFNITIDSRETPVTVIKSRRRSLVLEIINKGDIVVKAPYIISGSRIKSFLQSRSGWISSRLRQIDKSIKEYPLTPGSKIPFKGKDIELFILDSKDIKKELKDWYKTRAREEITTLVNRYSKLLKVNVNRIYIREQKTRWGSCSSKGNLSFNWKIILTRPELINYLVIHEMCHMIHMNHSKEYWKLVSVYDRDYRRHRKELNESGYYLSYFLK